MLYFTYILYGDPLGVVIGTLLNDNFERKYSVSLVNILAGLFVPFTFDFLYISVILKKVWLAWRS